jgi:hypothetical protein
MTADGSSPLKTPLKVLEETEDWKLSKSLLEPRVAAVDRFDSFLGRKAPFLKYVRIIKLLVKIEHFSIL